MKSSLLQLRARSLQLLAFSFYMNFYFLSLTGIVALNALGGGTTCILSSVQLAKATFNLVPNLVELAGTPQLISNKE